MHSGDTINYAPPDPKTTLLLKAIEGFLLILDSSGKILSMHGAFDDYPTLSSSELVDKYWFELFKSTQDGVTASQVFTDAMNNITHSPFISSIKLPDDKPLMLQWHFKPIAATSKIPFHMWAIGQKHHSPIPKTDQLESKYTALLENNRELTALYRISQIVVDMERPFEEKLIAISDLIQPVFNFPQKTEVFIRLDGVSYGTENFEATHNKLTEDVIVRDEKRGTIQVGYSHQSDSPACVGSTFPTKERQFLHKVARLLAFKLEKRELANQLKHADRLATIGQLAAGIAHELNNPLTDVLGFSQLALSQPDLPEETYQDLEKIVKSALYAREVIKKVLFFSRQSHPKVIRTDLNRMIIEWMDFFRKRCDQNSIKIVLALNPKLPVTRCDPGQLNQVLVNLVVNAIHAMPKGGILTIRTDTVDDCILVSIQDTGTGIKTEIFNKIFLPFFTTKEVDQGTGLGLSVVYGIIKEHGGAISVQSQEGEGSTFEVRLPFKID